MGKKVELFTAGSYLCDDMVQQVKSLVCSKFEVVIYNLNKERVTIEWEDVAKSYGIRSIPAVVFDGALIDLEKLRKS